MTANWNTIAHATTTTEFGQDVLADRDTNESWWAMHPEAEATVLEPIHVVTGTLNYDATLLDLVLPEGVREPDLFDDGRAMWIHADCVVSVAIERIGKVVSVVEKAERFVHGRDDRSTWWARVHPSLYGIDVHSYFGEAGDPEPVNAQAAWTMLAEAVAA